MQAARPGPVCDNAGMTSNDLQATIAHMGAAARAASTRMAAAPSAAKNAALLALARLLRSHTQDLNTANALDVQGAQAAGLAAPLVDRLKLTPEAVETVASRRFKKIKQLQRVA